MPPRSQLQIRVIASAMFSHSWEGKDGAVLISYALNARCRVLFTEDLHDALIRESLICLIIVA